MTLLPGQVMFVREHLIAYAAMKRMCSAATGVACWGLAVLLATPACSIVFVQGPPPAPARARAEPLECSTVPAWPIVDLAIAAVSLLELLGAATNPTEVYRERSTSRTAVVAGALTSGIVFTTSGFVGLSRISACNEARAEAATGPSLRVIKRRLPASPEPAIDADGAAATTGP
jgi:hypothetical protein